MNAQDHLDLLNTHPVLLQEVERFLLEGPPSEELDAMLAGVRTALTQWTSYITEGFFMHVNQAHREAAPIITLLMVTEPNRPTVKHPIQHVECIIVGTWGMAFDLLLDRNKVVPIRGNQTSYWRWADDSELGVAALKMVAVNRC